MCNQVAIKALRGIIRDRVARGLGRTLPDLPPFKRVVYDMQIPVVYPDPVDGAWIAEARRWRLLPHWLKPEALPSFLKLNTWNARGEDLLTKPTWREAYKKRRCIVPLDGFWERKAYFYNANPEEMVLCAGLYETWRGPEGDIHTATMVMTEPNEMVAEVHHRMPVILDMDGCETWLSPGFNEVQLSKLIRPCPEAWLDAVV